MRVRPLDSVPLKSHFRSGGVFFVLLWPRYRPHPEQRRSPTFLTLSSGGAAYRRGASLDTVRKRAYSG